MKVIIILSIFLISVCSQYSHVIFLNPAMTENEEYKLYFSKIKSLANFNDANSQAFKKCKNAAK